MSMATCWWWMVVGWGDDLKCGGKRSATPLWIVRRTAFRPMLREDGVRLKAELQTKAPSLPAHSK
jgi:hypothetical protein